MADPHKHAAGKMSTEEVRQKLFDIIVEALGVERHTVSDGANIVDDLGADSLDVVELVMVIEKEFNIAIPDEVAEKIVTVGDAIEHIRDALK